MGRSKKTPILSKVGSQNSTLVNCCQTAQARKQAMVASWSDFSKQAGYLDFFNFMIWLWLLFKTLWFKKKITVNSACFWGRNSGLRKYSHTGIHTPNTFWILYPVHVFKKINSLRKPAGTNYSVCTWLVCSLALHTG